jgi:hypothetical protein
MRIKLNTLVHCVDKCAIFWVLKLVVLLVTTVCKRVKLLGQVLLILDDP